MIGDITLVATAQQFGGFTLPELDKVLLPYVLKSEAAALEKFRQMGVAGGRAPPIAVKGTLRAREPGVPGGGV